jgi:dihydropteroate synthase
MFTLNCRGHLLVVDKPLVMGIINATPDSFYPGSRFQGLDEIVAKVEEMLADGADIIDIGGQSTRPGSKRINEEEESKRLIAPIKELIKRFPRIIISVDTYYSGLARIAVQEGASIVNDVSNGTFDKNMLAVVASLSVPFICMHIQGTPETMQVEPGYENLTREILDFFIQRKKVCTQSGIKDVIIDPGFGFGKTIDHNFELLKNLSIFKIAECPLLVGLSRKATVYKTLRVSAEEALNGTTVLNTVALLNGANILRVHDVKEARQAIELVQKAAVRKET